MVNLLSLRSALYFDHSKKYEVVKRKFDGHFLKRCNVIYERARFNQRRQERGKSVDALNTALYGLAEHCAYAGLHDEMIRDRIVVDLGDSKLSESLQLDPELTLEKAVSKARQSEAVKQQQPLVGGASGSPTASESHRQSGTHLEVVSDKHRRGQHPGKRRSDKPPGHKPKSKACGWCGKSPLHKKQQCPVKEAVCHTCGKPSHFQSVCRSVNVIYTDTDREPVSDSALDPLPSSREEYNFLEMVPKGDAKPWSITIAVNNEPIEFKIDMGAEVTVISSKVHHAIRQPTLQSAMKTLRGPSNEKLSVKGQFAATLQHGNKVTGQDLYVVDSLHKYLLGRPAIEALNLVSRVQKVEEGTPAQRNPELFVGLGKLEGEYTIQLEENAKPYSLSVPCRIAIPLTKAVKRELN